MSAEGGLFGFDAICTMVALLTTTPIRHLVLPSCLQPFFLQIVPGILDEKAIETVSDNCKIVVCICAQTGKQEEK
jgi:hypothetical protein